MPSKVPAYLDYHSENIVFKYNHGLMLGIGRRFLLLLQFGGTGRSVLESLFSSHSSPNCPVTRTLLVLLIAMHRISQVCTERE